MKKALKMAIIGAVLGGVELGAAGLLSGVGKLATFEDIAFLLGIFTLLIGLLGMFGVTRSHAGAAVSPGNVVLLRRILLKEKEMKSGPASLWGLDLFLPETGEKRLKTEKSSGPPD